MHGRHVETPHQNHGHQRNQAAARRRERRNEIDAEELFAEAYEAGDAALRVLPSWTRQLRSVR